MVVTVSRIGYLCSKKEETVGMRFVSRLGSGSSISDKLLRDSLRLGLGGECERTLGAALRAANNEWKLKAS